MKTLNMFSLQFLKGYGFFFEVNVYMNKILLQTTNVFFSDALVR